ncbi:hypothetical protein RFI_06720 [Reticulomyxa filosa]|uniref:SUN domain-containing protein n=1 Tax=Reticulomyxa filosa TaxID=46433 RepID=X6NYR1_RETFI|nr:hypothetical protein RFI_06720 [Reticulomyxa filosa]|eukprot:ETO30402.1 hypothetical protein RFI_06720 [Reticulomyxa filosa]
MNNRVNELISQLINKSTATNEVPPTAATDEQIKKIKDLVYKELRRPVNRAFRLVGTSRLLNDENDLLSVLKVIAPENTKSRTLPEVDLFMKNELESDDLPISDCLFMINEERPYVDIELSQRLIPTRFEYTHISQTHLKTDAMKLAKPIYFAVMAKKFKDEYFVTLGEWDMPSEESTLSVNLTDQNPEDFDFDVVRVIAVANPESRYVSVYRIKILSDGSASERDTDITTP